MSFYNRTPIIREKDYKANGFLFLEIKKNKKKTYALITQTREYTANIVSFCFFLLPIIELNIMYVIVTEEKGKKKNRIRERKMKKKTGRVKNEREI